MHAAGRNTTGLTEQEVEKCRAAWSVVCGTSSIELDSSSAQDNCSRTRFQEDEEKVYLGADAYPGDGSNANSRMSTLACLAHELAHAVRFHNKYRRPVVLPDVLIDEAETSLNASFNSVLNAKDREDLVEDARDRLIRWLAIRFEKGEENAS